MPQSPCCTLLTMMQWPPLWAHLFRMREGIRDCRMKRQCYDSPYHSLQSIDTRLHSPVCNIPMRSHSFKSELPPCRGVINKTKAGGLLLVRVYCIKHVRLVGVLLSNCVWQTGVCLIYSVLTQGQGHTVPTIGVCDDVISIASCLTHLLR